jgi:hypothetical protein
MRTDTQASERELRRNYIGIVSDRIEQQRAVEAVHNSRQLTAGVAQAILHSLRDALLRCKTR